MVNNFDAKKGQIKFGKGGKVTFAPFSLTRTEKCPEGFNLFLSVFGLICIDILLNRQVVIL